MNSENLLVLKNSEFIEELTGLEKIKLRKPVKPIEEADN